MSKKTLIATNRGVEQEEIIKAPRVIRVSAVVTGIIVTLAIAGAFVGGIYTQKAVDGVIRAEAASLAESFVQQ